MALACLLSHQACGQDRQLQLRTLAVAVGPRQASTHTPALPHSSQVLAYREHMRPGTCGGALGLQPMALLFRQQILLLLRASVSRPPEACGMPTAAATGHAPARIKARQPPASRGKQAGARCMAPSWAN